MREENTHIYNLFGYKFGFSEKRNLRDGSVSDNIPKYFTQSVG